MIIYLKNKQTLKVDDFYFNCSIGKKGLTLNKKEGDKKTPKGIFKLGNLYYRKDRIKLEKIKLHKTKIKSSMGWCDNPSSSKYYNKLINININKNHHEKLHRNDNKYDLIIPIKYNYYKPILKKGSCIFIHLTKDYKPTLGCIALKKKDFMIMLKLINKNTKIKI